MLIFNNKYWTFPWIKAIIVEISPLPSCQSLWNSNTQWRNAAHTHIATSHLFLSLCLLRPRPPSRRLTPSGRLCPNWETFTSTMPSARLTEPTGEPRYGGDGTVKSEISDWIFFNSSRSSSSSLPAPWWEWIFLRRLPASWWRRSLTTSPWLWRNLRGPSWPSSEGENFSFQQFIEVWTSECNRTCVKNYNPGIPVLTGP